MTVETMEITEQPVFEDQLPLFARITDRTVEVLLGHGSHGTGVILEAQHGLILTAAHVVEGHDTVRVCRWSLDPKTEGMKRRPGTHIARVEHVDRRRDFALLQMLNPPDDPKAIETATDITGRTPLGLPTYGVGFGANKLASGYVFGDWRFRGVKLYRIGMMLGKGSSGGPVCDQKGRLVGLNVRGVYGIIMPVAVLSLPYLEIKRQLRRLLPKL